MPGKDEDRAPLNVDAFLADLVDIVTGKKTPPLPTPPFPAERSSIAVLEEQFRALLQQSAQMLPHLRKAELQRLQKRVAVQQRRLGRLRKEMEARMTRRQQEQAAASPARPSEKAFEEWLHIVHHGISQQIEQIAHLRRSLEVVIQKMDA